MHTADYWPINTDWSVETQWQWCDRDGLTTDRNVGFEVAWMRGTRVIRSTNR